MDTNTRQEVREYLLSSSDITEEMEGHSQRSQEYIEWQAEAYPMLSMLIKEGHICNSGSFTNLDLLALNSHLLDFSALKICIPQQNEAVLGAILLQVIRFTNGESEKVKEKALSVYKAAFQFEIQKEAQINAETVDEAHDATALEESYEGSRADQFCRLFFESHYIEQHIEDLSKKYPELPKTLVRDLVVKGQGKVQEVIDFASPSEQELKEISDASVIIQRLKLHAIGKRTDLAKIVHNQWREEVEDQLSSYPPIITADDYTKVHGDFMEAAQMEEGEELCYLQCIQVINNMAVALGYDLKSENSATDNNRHFDR